MLCLAIVEYFRKETFLAGITFFLVNCVSAFGVLPDSGQPQWNELSVQTSKEIHGILFAIETGFFKLSEGRFVWDGEINPHFTAAEKLGADGRMISGLCSIELYNYLKHVIDEKKDEPTPGFPPWPGEEVRAGDLYIFSKAAIDPQGDSLNPVKNKGGYISKEEFVTFLELFLYDVDHYPQDARLGPTPEKLAQWRKFWMEGMAEIPLRQASLSMGEYRLVVMDNLTTLRREHGNRLSVLAQWRGAMAGILTYLEAQVNHGDAGEATVRVEIEKREKDAEQKMQSKTREYALSDGALWNYLLRDLVAQMPKLEAVVAPALATTKKPLQTEVQVPALFPAELREIAQVRALAHAFYRKTYGGMPAPAQSVAQIVKAASDMSEFAHAGAALWQVSFYGADDRLLCVLWINPQNPLALDPSVKGADASINAQAFRFILPPIDANPAMVEPRK